MGTRGSATAGGNRTMTRWVGESGKVVGGGDVGGTVGLMMEMYGNTASYESELCTRSINQRGPDRHVYTNCLHSHETHHILNPLQIQVIIHTAFGRTSGNGRDFFTLSIHSCLRG